MAHETVTKSKRFYCVSLSPDFCKTPVGSSVVVLPYNIKGEFKDAADASRNVKTQGEPVLLHNKSFIPNITGDERGTLGGIKSQTYLKRAQPMEFSSTKGSNGAQTIQESRLIYMNDKNTIGRIHERQVQAPRPRLTILGVELPTLKEAAQEYKDKYSEPMHQFGGKAMDVGGKIGMGSAALGGAGLAVGATGVGLPAAAVMETGAAAGATVGGGVAATGLAVDSTATALDNAANFVLTGKAPDVMGMAGDMAWNAAENLALKKLPFVGGWIKKLAAKKNAVPGKTPTPPKKAPPEPKKADGGKGDKEGHDGGKTKKPKGEKADKPSDCCPKNGAPGGKPVKSKRPVHFGTGEEILQQTDFVLEGPTPLEWVRTYRSGSETEDWGVLGARWATPFTSSISVCAQGIVYHDDSGRALRLPMLAIGQEHDSRAEGFTLRRDSENQITLVWRDGANDTYLSGPDGWLPHGYQGVNAMLAPRAPVRAQRYYLGRHAGRDGNGIQIERIHEAKPGEALLRIRTDDGLMLEALRDGYLPEEVADDAPVAMPRIGRVERVDVDGSRQCLVRYRYEASLIDASDPLTTFPLRCDLVEQTDLVGQSRTYSYQHHLLRLYTTYTGFAHGLEWVSLAFLRERWAGSLLGAPQLAERHPINFNNSYQARAIRTNTSDGNGEVQIDYVDADTTRVTEADGGVLEYSFNANWLATCVLRIGPDGNARVLGRREWDRDGMLLAEIDAEHNATRYEYDLAGNLTSITDAQGNTTHIEYDGHNQPIAVTDALGHTTRSRYDEAGRIVERIDALGHSTGYAYDAHGRMSLLTDARGGTKRLVYDQGGRLAAYTDCSGFTTRYNYDRNSRLAEHIDAAGNTSHYAYNAHGQLAAVTRPDQTTEQFEYDAEGQLLAYTDGKGQVTRYRYNGHGQPIERIDAKGQTLSYVYDKALRLIELINGNGESYRFAYDAESRLVGETGFDGKTTSYTYNQAGQLIGTACNGVQTEFARDALGQLLAKSSPDGAVRYAYDALGRLIAVTSPQAENRFEYDALGQLVDERVAYALAAPRLPDTPREYVAAFTMTHAYDELGNRIQTILPNGRRIDTLRYGSGHWHGTLWQGKSLVDLERDQLHRETARQLGGERERLTESRSYDPQSRLRTFTLSKGAERLHERRYEYDAASNLTLIDDLSSGSTRYTYDPLGQLLSATQRDLKETFAFDPAGNLLDPDASGNPVQIDTRKVLRELDAQPTNIAAIPPKLAKVTHNLLRQYMGYVYEYDVQGNTISKRLRVAASANDEGVLEFSYDTENRLTTATRTFANSRQIARYSYDAFGRRIAKQLTSQRWDAPNAAPSAEVTDTDSLTLFVWDGDTLLQEVWPDKTITYLYEPNSFVPLARIDSGEGAACYKPANSHLCRIEEWALPGVKNDPDAHVEIWQVQQEFNKAQVHRAESMQRFEQADGNSSADHVLHYRCDHLGTPLELIDCHGEIFWSARYRAWGGVLRYGVANVVQALRFQGQYYDEETGLHYNRHRYYDPSIGRFLSQDPIGLSGGENPYIYGPNPTRWTDPNGLKRTPHVGNCADDVARSALDAANAKAIKNNKEYGGLIYEKGGKYYATIPVPGTGRTFKPIFALPQVPSGATVVGDYHTHGDYSLEGKNGSVIRTSDPLRDSFKSDNFSDSDRRTHMFASQKNKCHKSYLGTPSGKYKVLQGGIEHEF
ncbi:RHS repeat-associated core domain-containing protein [Pseudoduganella sp. R-31]|uniref:RHS repeat-associated core domain-containing protein n=1 Tax=Pseudoduganella sp. R-31 TaxID=3404060 RepID=UPI003CF25CE0